MEAILIYFIAMAATVSIVLKYEVRVKKPLPLAFPTPTRRCFVCRIVGALAVFIFTCQDNVYQYLKEHKEILQRMVLVGSLSNYKYCFLFRGESYA
jgi:hypothetical protein